MFATRRGCAIFLTKQLIIDIVIFTWPWPPEQDSSLLLQRCIPVT